MPYLGVLKEVYNCLFVFLFNWFEITQHFAAIQNLPPKAIALVSPKVNTFLTVKNST